MLLVSVQERLGFLLSSAFSPSLPTPLITINSRHFALRPVKTRTVLHFYRFISSSGRSLGCWGFYPGPRKLPNFCAALIAVCLPVARPDQIGRKSMGQTIKLGRGRGGLMPLISLLGELDSGSLKLCCWGLGDKRREV